MPTNPDSGFHFRDLELADYYRANYKDESKTDGQLRSLLAKRDLERYQWVMRSELLRLVFSEAEAIALWSALNGCNTAHVEQLDILRNGVISEIAEDVEENPALLNLKGKLIALSPSQWFAVIDACDRVGAGSYQIENLADELKRVGLLE
jgi:hypothetical protein